MKKLWQKIKEMKKRYWAILVAVLAIAISLFLFYHAFQILPGASIYLFPEMTQPQSTDRILIFSPHPDDETLGNAGLIKKSVENKATIKVVIVSDGNKHGLKNERHAEVESALKILGLNFSQIEFLDLPDGKLNQVSNLEQLINQEAIDFHPTIILTTNNQDIHKDHAAVGKAVEKAISGMDKKPIVYEYLIHYHRYPRPTGLNENAYLLPPAKLIVASGQWQKLTLTKETIDLKKQAVEQYKTQLNIKNPVLRDLMFSFVRQNEMFLKEN